LVLVGIPDGDTYTLAAAEARRRRLKIKFSRRMGDVYLRAIELVHSERVNVADLVTHRRALSDASAAFQDHADQKPGMVKTILWSMIVFGETPAPMFWAATLLMLTGMHLALKTSSEAIE